MGRKKSKDGDSLMVGEWNPKNAHDFMKYTASKGYRIDSYELGKPSQAPQMITYLVYFISQMLLILCLVFTLKCPISPGNELCGSGVSARIEAEQYGKDVIVLKKLVQELYPDPVTQPKVLGPAGFYDKQWFNTFLQTSGPNVVDGLTHHIYNLGAGMYENHKAHQESSSSLSKLIPATCGVGCQAPLQRD